MTYKPSKLQSSKEELIDVKQKLKVAQEELKTLQSKTAAEKAAEKRALGLDDLTKKQRDQLADAVALSTLSHHDKLQIAYIIGDACNFNAEARGEFYSRIQLVNTEVA